MAYQKTGNFQSGMSLVEVMVGLVIGLVVTLVITQVLTTYEGQRRTTSGTADAQTNGSLALYAVQREALLAGFGLPVFEKDFSPLNCATVVPANASVALVTIEDGGNGAGTSDRLTVNYGNSPYAGALVVKRATTTDAETLACPAGDESLALTISGANCQFMRKGDVPDNTTISCPGTWAQVQFRMNGNELIREETLFGLAVPPLPGQLRPSATVGSDIVAFKAQYGVSDSSDDNEVKQWVNATGSWTPAMLAANTTNRNRIKALRVVVAARNAEMEKTDVAPVAGLIWAGSATSPIDVSNTPDWRRYRYRVFETVIPLRNMIWSRESLAP